MLCAQMLQVVPNSLRLMDCSQPGTANPLSMGFPKQEWSVLPFPSTEMN